MSENLRRWENHRLIHFPSRLLPSPNVHEEKHNCVSSSLSRIQQSCSSLEISMNRIRIRCGNVSPLSAKTGSSDLLWGRETDLSAEDAIEGNTNREPIGDSSSHQISRTRRRRERRFIGTNVREREGEDQRQWKRTVGGERNGDRCRLSRMALLLSPPAPHRQTDNRNIATPGF